MQMVHPGPCERDRSSLIAPAGSVCSNQTEGGAKIVDSDSTVERRTHLGGCARCTHLPPTAACLSRSDHRHHPHIVLLEPRTLRLATPAISSAACAGHHNKSRQASTYRHALASRAFRGGSQSSGDRSSSNATLPAAQPSDTVPGSARCCPSRSPVATMPARRYPSLFIPPSISIQSHAFRSCSCWARYAPQLAV
ncbi:hypothetical protein PYCCODRAFT_1260417 [Trametes coccinea BRFM310]|uniref:Uncharacterized protein n=1 Tax=Trametes coccinea (strain BRFM310) TaxID=1353009 RepID=A0A1Y2I644_TRAC3|nr:hypothetical protein PYCCODRAFT_1260417 [Trametes coccinea BRFM310]